MYEVILGSQNFIIYVYQGLNTTQCMEYKKIKEVKTVLHSDNPHAYLGAHNTTNFWNQNRYLVIKFQECVFSVEMIKII